MNKSIFASANLESFLKSCQVKNPNKCHVSMILICENENCDVEIMISSNGESNHKRNILNNLNSLNL